MCSDLDLLFLSELPCKLIVLPIIFNSTKLMDIMSDIHKISNIPPVQISAASTTACQDDDGPEAVGFSPQEAHGQQNGTMTRIEASGSISSAHTEGGQDTQPAYETTTNVPQDTASFLPGSKSITPDVVPWTPVPGPSALIVPESNTCDYPPSVSGSEIELVALAPPPPRTGFESTENLITSPSRQDPLLQIPKHQTLRSTSTAQTKASLALCSYRPDYKPAPLRWPYQVLLLCLVAGFFAFLEYETRLLPAPRFHLIDLSLKHVQTLSTQTTLGPQRAAKDVIARTTFQVASSTAFSPQSMIDPTPQITPAPRPFLVQREAIPPPESFPDPGSDWGDGSKYCFWHPPKWKIQMRGWSSGLAYMHQVTEYIDLFTASSNLDENNQPVALCPCHGIRYTTDGVEMIRVGSTDESCQSVFNAIRSMNERGPWFLPPDLSIDLEWARYDRTWTTPPPISVPWIQPSTAPDGEIMMPLEISTWNSGPNPDSVSDVFGNRLEAPYSGAFVPGYTGTEVIYTLTAGGSFPLITQYWTPITTLTYPSRLISWWKLPLSRPTTTEPTATSTSSGAGELTSPITTRTSQGPVSTISSKASAPASTKSVSIVSTTPQSAVSSTMPTKGASDSGASPSDMSVPVSSTHIEPVREETPPRSLSDKIVPTSPSLRLTHTEPVREDPPPRPTSNRNDDLGPNNPGAVEGNESPTHTGTLNPIIAAVPLDSSSFDATLALIPGITSTQSLDSTLPAPDTTPTISRGPSIDFEHPISVTTVLASWSIALAITGYDRVTAFVPVAVFTFPSSTFDEASKTFRITVMTTTKTIFPGVMDWTFITTPTPVPLPPISGPLGDPNPTKFFNLRTEKDYILASLIPVLLATLLAIPLQLFTKSVNRMMPFRGLKGGALAQDTLLLSRSPNLLTTPAISLRFLRRYHDPLPMCNTLLTLFALVLVPLSAETIMIEFMSEPCTTLEWPVDPFGYAGPCPRGLRKSVLPTRAAEGLLCLIAVLVLAIGYLLLRWWSGVANEPWSLGGLMALLANSSDEVRNNLLELGRDGRTKDLGKEIEKAVTRRGKKFQLGYFHFTESTSLLNAAATHPEDSRTFMFRQDVGTYYGIYTVDQKVRALTRRPSGKKSRPAPWWKPSQWLGFTKKGTASADEEAGQARKQNKSSRSATGGSLGTLYRVLALTLITGILIVILYYENTILDTPFERFMDSQTFGVRFLFAGLGTGISLFWDWYFTHASSQHVFYRLYRPRPIGRPTPMNAQAGNIKTINAATRDSNVRKILQSPPSSELVSLGRFFTTIFFALSQRLRRSRAQSRAQFRKRPDDTCGPEISQASSSWQENNFLLDLAIPLATLLARFTPILLAGVPFRNTITWKMHEAYTWCVVGVLGYMVIVLVWDLLWSYVRSWVWWPRRRASSMWKSAGNVVRLGAKMLRRVRVVKGGHVSHSDGRGTGTGTENGLELRERDGQDQGRQLLDGHRGNGISTPPPLPISPNTLAGSMYHVCADPKMLRDFEGLSLVSQREKGRLLLSSRDEVTGSEDAGHGQEGEAGREGKRKAKEYVFGELCEEASGLERIGIYTCTVHA